MQGRAIESIWSYVYVSRAREVFGVQVQVFTIIMQVWKCLWRTKLNCFFCRCVLFDVKWDFGSYATNSNEYVLKVPNVAIEFDFIAKVLDLLKSNLCNPSQARMHSKFQVNPIAFRWIQWDVLRYYMILFIYSDCWLLQTKHLHAIETIYIWNC